MLNPILHTPNSYIPHHLRHSSRSQVIYIILLLAICAFVASLFFITVDVNVQSRGVITTTNRQSDAISAMYGKVLRTNLKENTLVGYGDTLVIIDTNEISQNISLLNTRIALVEAEQKDLVILTQSTVDRVIVPDTFASPKYQQEHQKLRADWAYLQAEVLSLRKEFLRQQKLHKSKVIADSEFEQAKFRYESSSLKQKQLIESQLAQWQAQLQNGANQILTLRESILALQKEFKKCFITAPAKGYTQNVTPLQPETAIFPNQKLCSISPTEGLLVEAYVSPADIGFIYLGQNVTLRVDAFNANRWGTLSAKVSDISNDISVENGKLLGFRVLCQPNGFELKYEEKKVNVKKGMTLTVNFILTERTLAQLLFDDVSEWLNPNNPNIEAAQ